MKQLFVTGTDTGVGKTTVACAMVTAFARRGQRVAVMKPCETGGGDDAERLIAASGRAQDPALVCPYRFALPASPEAAAQEESTCIEIERIVRAFARLVSGADLALVEGAGGLLVPIGNGQTMADLALALGLPILIVARPSLGTINHTLLTIEAARRRGLRVLGVALSRVREEVGPDEPTNPAAIARYGDLRVLGTLPRLGPGDDPALAAERHLDLDTLWASL